MIPSFEHIKEGWPELRMVHGRAVRPFLRQPWCGAKKNPHELDPTDMAELWERVKFWIDIYTRYTNALRFGVPALDKLTDLIPDTGHRIQ